MEPSLEQAIKDYLYGWDIYSSDVSEGLANHIRQLFRCQYEPVEED